MEKKQLPKHVILNNVMWSVLQLLQVMIIKNMIHGILIVKNNIILLIIELVMSVTDGGLQKDVLALEMDHQEVHQAVLKSHV